jgi:hypothetical protein
MDKQSAISILKDIQKALYSDKWRDNTLKIIDIYKKDLQTSNKKIGK